MTQTQKHRLIGFIVILCIAVIVLPMLLDGAGYREHQRLDINIPPEPEPLTFNTYTPQNPQLPDTAELPDAPGKASENLPEQSSEAGSEMVSENASVSVAASAPAASQSDAAAETQSSSKTVARPALALEEKPQLDEQGVPIAWTLQLASFQDQSNATALRQKLIGKGYKAYIRQKDDLHKVFVGPDVQRTVVEQLKQDLQQEFKLDGLILRFSPQ